MARNEELFTAIMKGNRNKVVELIQKAVEANEPVGKILDDSMIPAMREMGDKFSRNEVYVPEMLIAARAMQAGLALIEPKLAQAGHKALGKVAIGTVKGDLHDIGKNLVAIMLKGAGYEVMDLGVNCDADKFAGAAQNGAQVLCCSALLTTTMPYMKDIVEKVKGTGAKVIIGGAPVTNEYAKSIGADGYGCDANDAVKVIDKLLGKSAA
jgi:5-methyltetrahydrofolate--homocysteine methyltransferase